VSDGHTYVTDPGPYGPEGMPPEALPLDACSIDTRAVVYALAQVTRAILSVDDRLASLLSELRKVTTP
jgi:hypothetical protein